MKLLGSSCAAAAVLLVAWVAGGPIGAALNAPGLLCSLERGRSESFRLFTNRT
jgi:hypothetical protein